MTTQLKLAVIPGDGTGLEVTDQALRILDAIAPKHGISVDSTRFGYGGEHYLKTGEVITDDQVDQLRDFDAIMLGAVGHPEVKPGILEKGLLLKLRFQLDQYINLRPVKLYEGIDTPLAGKTPDDIDFVCVRENTEDLYCGNGGRARVGTPQEISTQEMIVNFTTRIRIFQLSGLLNMVDPRVFAVVHVGRGSSVPIAVGTANARRLDRVFGDAFRAQRTEERPGTA